MQIAVLADVHGNLTALEAVLGDLNDLYYQRIIVAGDLIAGPQPNETIQLLRDRNAWMILGNSDLNLLRLTDGQAPEAWLTARQFGLLRWNAANISPEKLDFLRRLPAQGCFRMEGTDPIRVVHGSPCDPFESIFPDEEPSILDQALDMISETTMICGHTHSPWIRRRKGKLAVNPGSVAGPLNGEVGAQYARLVYDGGTWQVELRTIQYDHNPVRRAFEESGLLAEGGALARAFLCSMETGKDYALAFLEHACKEADRAGCPEEDAIPDEIWDFAEQTFPWPN